MEHKYLDAAGITHLWSKLSLEDYPNNELLVAVINAIDKNKADKEQLPPDTNEPQKQLVTNESGEKVWEDKLAYTQPEEVVCLTKEVTKGNIEMFSADVALQAGECIIEYNGKTYTVVAEDLGGVAALRFNSSDNFPGYSYMFITPPNVFINENRTWPGESGTLTIKQVQNVVHKMDAKYLPVSIRSELGKDDLILGDTMGQRMQDFTPGIGSLTHHCSEASGSYAAAFNHSKAQGFDSFSANYGEAEGDYSAAFGNATAKGDNQLALGKYNILDENDEHFFIIGNGSRKLNEDQTAMIEKFSNAATISRQGEAWFSGDVYVGSTSGTNKDSGSKKLATEEYVRSLTVQPDWNQSDETAADYIKNKPFGSTYAEVDILEETTITEFADGLGGLITTPPNGNLSKDLTYQVTYNGTLYNCLAYEADLQGMAVIALGNGPLFDKPSEEPFGIICVPSEIVNDFGAYMIVIPFDESTQITISISGQSETIYKIDNKYIQHNNSYIMNGSQLGSLRTALATLEQENDYTIGYASFAEGEETKASGQASHAEGSGTTASGQHSHAEGGGTTASGSDSHAEGGATKAEGDYSHAEGGSTTASGFSSHAEGNVTTAEGNCSHAEGYYTTAKGNYSHVEGSNTTAKGNYSHAEGNSNIKAPNNISKNSTLEEILTERDKNAFTLAFSDCTHAEGSNTIAFGMNSHAEGSNTIAYRKNSHAEGSNTTASGESSHVEGGSTTASGMYSHAEGSNTTASGTMSHAEGGSTTASGAQSHAEGTKTIAEGSSSHAEGDNTKASGNYSHAEGDNTKAEGDYSHAEGHYTTASNFSSHAEGYNTTASGSHSHAEGDDTTAEGDNSHAEGNDTTASGISSHAEGGYTKAEGDYSHAEGGNTTASGNYSHAEGELTKAEGDHSHAEGSNTTASGIKSHAEGQSTTASGEGSHAEGSLTTAEGSYSHAEGCRTTAEGISSHAEGDDTTASGNYSHAEGYNTTASGESSHAEGDFTTAEGDYSHTEGQRTSARGTCAHAEGSYTQADGVNQHVQGKYNIANISSTYAHIVGNGSSQLERSNAHTLDWDGNAWYAGDVYVGSTSGTNRDDGSKKLATEEYVDSKFNSVNTPQSQVILVDQETGENYILCIKNGNLVTYKAE